MKAKQFAWIPDTHGAGFRAAMPDAVTLVVTPEHTTGLFGAKPKRGTMWRAQASQFDGKFTVSGFGRDEYMTQHKTMKDAMRAAEAIYLDAVAPA